MPFATRNFLFSGHLVIPCVFLSFILASGNALAQDRYEKQRFKMVNEQIIPRGVTNTQVVKAMKRVERHLFDLKSIFPWHMLTDLCLLVMVRQFHNPI